MQNIQIETDFIPLGQFLKLANILDSGGMVKMYLQDVGVYVNDEIEHRRGRKLYPGDVIQTTTGERFIVVKEEG